MKILLIHQIYMSPDEAGGTRHHELSRHLVQRGHQVTIVASTVSYLTGKKTGVREQDSLTPTVIRAWAYPGVQRTYFTRLLSFVSFMITSFFAALTVPRVDVVWGTSPPLFQALTAWLVARLKRVPFVFEVRDLWPDFAIQTGVLRNPLLISLARQAERFLYRHADRLIVNSPGFIPHISKLTTHKSQLKTLNPQPSTPGIASRRVALVANGVEPAMFDPSARGEKARAHLGMKDKFIALYAGALGLANDLGVLLQAAERLRDSPDIAVVLLGDGKERPRLMRQAAEAGLGNVRIVSAVPKSAIGDYLAAADVCIAILKPPPNSQLTTPNSQLSATTYPNKVFDYMAAGRPTILAIDGVIRDLIEKAQAGAYVQPGDPNALARAIFRYRTNPELCLRHGYAARHYVTQHFDRRLQADRLEEIFRETAFILGHSARTSGGAATRSEESHPRFPSSAKRLFDLSLTIPGLVLIGPALALLALLVRVKLGGPVLFRQQRPGWHGQPFLAYKFRTMNEDRRATSDADRLTPFGRFLRSWSLDELPSLFNVLKGEMSLVGPRPLLMEYLDRYSTEQARRHEVKPGITGWAQVNGRNALTWDEKFRLDVWYVDNWSLWLDLRILARTVKTVLARKNVSAPGHATAPAFTGAFELLNPSTLELLSPPTLGPSSLPPSQPSYPLPSVLSSSSVPRFPDPKATPNE
jgi:lipopolysaccharide/colanic/teichoic acid biosynthesis glycosyltransferase/glycosyltransferase involved in cell wall biosynthesis